MPAPCSPLCDAKHRRHGHIIVHHQTTTTKKWSPWLPLFYVTAPRLARWQISDRIIKYKIKNYRLQRVIFFYTMTASYRNDIKQSITVSHSITAKQQVNIAIKSKASSEWEKLGAAPLAPPTMRRSTAWPVDRIYRPTHFYFYNFISDDGEAARSVPYSTALTNFRYATILRLTVIKVTKVRRRNKF